MEIKTIVVPLPDWVNLVEMIGSVLITLVAVWGAKGAFKRRPR